MSSFFRDAAVRARELQDGAAARARDVQEQTRQRIAEAQQRAQQQVQQAQQQAREAQQHVHQHAQHLLEQARQLPEQGMTEARSMFAKAVPPQHPTTSPAVDRPHRSSYSSRAVEPYLSRVSENHRGPGALESWQQRASEPPQQNKRASEQQQQHGYAFEQQQQNGHAAEEQQQNHGASQRLEQNHSAPEQLEQNYRASEEQQRASEQLWRAHARESDAHKAPSTQLSGQPHDFAVEGESRSAEQAQWHEFRRPSDARRRRTSLTEPQQHKAWLAPIVLACTVIGVGVASGTLGGSKGTASAFGASAPIACYGIDFPPAPFFQPPPTCAETNLTSALRTNYAQLRSQLVAARSAYPRRHSSAHAEWRSKHGCLRGVNLGSWLLLEQWMLPAELPVQTLAGPIPSPFSGEGYAAAADEHSLTQLLAQAGELDRLTAFRDEFVTRADFERMACLGINSVRIPFGYWLATGSGNTSTGASGHFAFFTGRGLHHLDEAIGWAEEFGIGVLLDLHGAPGGQSGSQTTGRANPSWRPEHFDADAAIEVIRTVARRYAGRRGVLALELLNEPALPAQQALDFYIRATAAVRQAGMRAADVAIVLSQPDLSRLLDHGSLWRALLAPGGLPADENVILDLHLYYAFLARQLDGLPLCFVTGELVDKQAELLGLLGLPTLVGEWSLRVPWRGPQADEFAALAPPQQGALLAAFAQRQVGAISAHNESVGGFFWAWNAPASDVQWGYQRVLEQGWLAKAAWPSCRAR